MNSKLEHRSRHRLYAVAALFTAEIAVPEGGVGVIVSEDLSGRELKPGKHALVFDFKYDGTGVFTVDGGELAIKAVKHTIPMITTMDETMDIGSDTRPGVDDSDKPPSRFTGTVDRLTFKLGPSQMTVGKQKAAAETIKKVTD